MPRGTIISWNEGDAVGRVRLDDAEEVRFGMTAARGGRPALGLRVEVHQLQPHPLGGRKAVDLELLDEPAVAVTPQATQQTDHSQWLLDRLSKSQHEAVPTVEVQNLINGYLMFSGKAQPTQLFGVDVSGVPASRREALRAAVERELLAWHARLDTPVDRLMLHKVGRQLGLTALTTNRLPLRCDPLGSTEGLPASWLRRVSALSEAVKGLRPLKLEAFGLEATSVTFGTPDPDTLYEFALRFETTNDAPFPRALAALVATADGLSLDGTPFIRPIEHWQLADDGLDLGSGSTEQGALTLLEKKTPMPEWPVVDRDDDGVTLHRFSSLGALWDGLLGLT